MADLWPVYLVEFEDGARTLSFDDAWVFCSCEGYPTIQAHDYVCNHCSAARTYVRDTLRPPKINEKWQIGSYNMSSTSFDAFDCNNKNVVAMCAILRRDVTLEETMLGALGYLASLGFEVV